MAVGNLLQYIFNCYSVYLKQAHANCSRNSTCVLQICTYIFYVRKSPVQNPTVGHSHYNMRTPIRRSAHPRAHKFQYRSPRTGGSTTDWHKPCLYNTPQPATRYNTCRRLPHTAARVGSHSRHLVTASTRSYLFNDSRSGFALISTFDRLC